MFLHPRSSLWLMLADSRCKILTWMHHKLVKLYFNKLASQETRDKLPVDLILTMSIYIKVRLKIINIYWSSSHVVFRVTLTRDFKTLTPRIFCPFLVPATLGHITCQKKNICDLPKLRWKECTKFSPKRRQLWYLNNGSPKVYSSFD